MGRLQSCKGVRVVDLSRAHAGPFGSQLLGDLGAEIIKIEAPYIGDDTRAVFPQLEGGMSYYFLAVNRNKKGIILDLMTPSGKKAIYDLVKVSDVIYDNFRHGVLDRLGLNYEAVSKINPRIISCSIVGYGSSGPLSSEPSYDDVATAISGMYSLCGEPGGTPIRGAAPVVDIVSGIYAAVGVLTGLYERTLTGKGKRVEVNLLHTSFSLLQTFYQRYFLTGEVPQGQGSKHVTVPFAGAFATRNGYIALGPCWPRIARAVNREHLIDDPRFATAESRSKNKVELEAIIEEALKEYDSEDWVELLREQDIPVGKVNNIAEALQDPQVVYNNPVVKIKYEGGEEIEVVDCPVKAIGEPSEEHTPPPRHGEHSMEVFKQILGYSDAEINVIREEEKQHAEELYKHIRSGH